MLFYPWVEYTDVRFSMSNSRVGVMVLNATFNNISVISWRSILLVEETGILGENHQSAASCCQAFSYNVVSSTPRHGRDSYSQRYR